MHIYKYIIYTLLYIHTYILLSYTPTSMYDNSTRMAPCMQVSQGVRHVPGPGEQGAVGEGGLAEEALG